MQISAYHCLNDILEMTKDGIRQKKMTPRTRARIPQGICSMRTKTRPTTIRYIQKEKVRYLRDLAWFSDFYIVPSTSKPHPQPKHWKIPQRNRR